VLGLKSVRFYRRILFILLFVSAKQIFRQNIIEILAGLGWLFSLRNLASAEAQGTCIDCKNKLHSFVPGLS
jgi:hypothetical protein